MRSDPHVRMRHRQGNVAPNRRGTDRIALKMRTDSLPDNQLELQSSKRDGQQVDSRAYEEEHVHDVYQQIASHFSSTRYKV